MLPDFRSLQPGLRAELSPSSCLLFLTLLIFTVDRYRWTSPVALHPHNISHNTRLIPTLQIQLQVAQDWAWPAPTWLYFLNTTQGDSNV